MTTDNELNGLANIAETLLRGQQAINEAHARRREFLEFYGPLPPLSRRQRIRRKLAWRIERTREAVALRIAPWLGDA